MNNPDNPVSIPSEGGKSHPQEENVVSVSVPSFLSGIPGLGRLGNSPKSEGSQSSKSYDITENFLEPQAVTKESISESTSPQFYEDFTMADAEHLVKESATSTSNDAPPTIPTDTPLKLSAVGGDHSGPSNGEIDSLMRQTSQAKDAKIITQDTNSNAMDIEIAHPPTTEVHVEQDSEMSTGEALETQFLTSADDHQKPETHAEPPELTHALEAMLGGLSQPAAVNANVETIADAPAVPATEDGHPEWEVDSSPYESSSGSSDSSSEDDSEDEDGDNAYKLLSPEEQAKILMEGDGGSDDEGASKGTKGPGAQLRTKNEVPEEIIPKPDVTITAEMLIKRLGDVEGIVENIILIKAFTTGEYQVLREDSVLCLQDRSVIGVVSETLGRVEQPLYCVRFTNAAAIAEAGLSVGTTVYYSEQHSTYVFTQALKAYKGTDASNLYDEEVGDEEMEFSDDEKEAEHKRRIRQRKAEKRGGKTQQNGGHSHGGHASQQSHNPGNNSAALNYDEAEDGPYKTLTRPTGFTGGANGGEAPQEGSHHGRPSHRGDHGGRSRGRGRGDRGRGDQSRGRGRGGGNNDRSNNQSRGAPSNSSPGLFNSQPLSLPQKPNFPIPPPASNIYNNPNPPQYHTQQAPSWPMYPQNYQQPYQQPRQQPYPHVQNNWPAVPPLPPMPTGAFINPAFFNPQNGVNQNGQNLWGHPGHQN